MIPHVIYGIIKSYICQINPVVINFRPGDNALPNFSSQEWRFNTSSATKKKKSQINLFINGV